MPTFPSGYLWIVGSQQTFLLSRTDTLSRQGSNRTSSYLNTWNFWGGEALLRAPQG